MTDVLFANDKLGEYPPSWHHATANSISPFPALEEDVTCDVCVVGGGYSGLSAALALAERGYEVVLLEAHRVGWGASGRNGGQVGSGQRRDQDDLEKMVGLDHAKDLWNLAQQSKQEVRGLIHRHNINCDYKPGIIEADHRARFVAHTRNYVDHLNHHYNYQDIRFLDKDEIRNQIASPAYFGGSLDKGAGHLHPLNFALGLANAAHKAGVQIFEMSQVDTIDKGSTVAINVGSKAVKASHVILACNGYLGNLDGSVAARVMPINNFIIATEPLGYEKAKSLIQDNVAVADSKFVVNYFRRSHDNRLLFGGAESYGYRFPKDITALVRKPMLQIFPQLKDTAIDYAWGGTLAITINRMPHFARVSANILSISGYSGHGLAMATLAGKLAAEATSGTAERFDVMAKVPSPRFPGGVALRWPLLVLAMMYYSLRDRL